MPQWLIIYGDVKHPHIYATAYDETQTTQLTTKCAARHGAAKRVRAILAEKMPPSRVTN